MKTVMVIDGDGTWQSQLGPWLKKQGWSLLDGSNSGESLELALRHKPEIILCDVHTPGLEAFQFCRDIRRQKDPYSSTFIIATGNGRMADKIMALESGADEYMVKPFAPLVLEKFLGRFGQDPGRAQPTDTELRKAAAADNVRLRFWGVRGSIPSPGPETVYYGGNTSCIEVRVGSNIIVLDAGSGLRRLGLSLMREFKEKPMQLNLLITHTHWDHIQGFPFFLPAYDPKNKVTIYGYEGASKGLQGTLSSQMESPYFPISMREMPGHIAVNELRAMEFDINEVHVKAHLLNHPGHCSGYRLYTPGGSISYLPDIELYNRLRYRWDAETQIVPPKDRQTSPPEDEGLIEFIRGSDVLILDSQYDAEEYEKHIGWGHSCVEDSVAFALHAGVKRLFLFHHDPDHTDEQISRMVARARQMAARRRSDLIVEAAREGFELVLSGKT